VLDLHGNSKKKEKVPNSGEADKNIFDIRQGVAIGIFVKLPPGARAKKKEKAPASFTTASLGRARQRKYDWLNGHHVENTPWKKLDPARRTIFSSRKTPAAQGIRAVLEITELIAGEWLGHCPHAKIITRDFDERALLRIPNDLSCLTEQAIDLFGIRRPHIGIFAKARNELSGDPSSSVNQFCFGHSTFRYIYYEKAMMNAATIGMI